MNGSTYAMVAEFDNEDALVAAAERTREAGYKRIDAYSPFPVHGLPEAIGFRDIWVPWIIFLAGLAGAATGYGLQYYISAIDFPINSGGRPYHSWPNFIPVTFELTVLFAAFGAVLGMLALNGLPRPYHPIFNTPRFERATNDRFFLAIEARDPKFDPDEVRRFLEGLEPLAVSEVEP